MFLKNDDHYIIKVPVSVIKNVKSILANIFTTSFKDFALMYKNKYLTELYVYYDQQTNKFTIFTESLRKSGKSEEFASENDFILKSLIQKIDFLDERNSTNNLNCSLNESKYISISYKKPIKNIVNFFDEWKKWNVGDIYEIHIGNVYDPSKFWIMFKKPDLFQEYLYFLYNENNKTYKMRESNIFIGCYCVVLIDNLYYRGKLVRRDDEKCIRRFKVYLFDFGMIATVYGNQLFMMDTELFDIPEMAVRASLDDITPVDNLMWSQNVINRFIEIITNKRLIIQVLNVNQGRKILNVRLYKVSKTGPNSISNILLKERLAKPIDGLPQVKENFLYKPIVNYMYHLPTFEFIENGVYYDKSSNIEVLKTLMPWDVLFKEYYEYVGR